MVDASRKVLFVAYYFPPLGMGGVQRAAKFVKYLPEFGWEPVVVTVKDVAYFAKDEALAREVEGRRMHRTGSLDPQRLLAMVRGSGQAAGHTGPSRGLGRLWRVYETLARWVFIPDAKVLWLPFATCRAMRLVKEERISVVVTTSPPVSAHLVGLVLRRWLGCRWVADFRDQWTGGHLDLSPTRLHSALNRALERLVLRCADAVVCVSRQLSVSLRDKSGRERLPVAVIPNGYDEQDFRPVQMRRSSSRNVVYCGSLSRLADPSNLLKACASLVGQRPDLRGRLRLTFVGESIGLDLSGLVARLGLHGLVHATGYVEHESAVRFLQEADVLVLLLTGTTSRDVVPGKVFEYLRAGKPILAIVPPGETADLLRRHAPASVLSDNTVESIEQALLGMLTSPQRTRRADKVGLQQFERRSLTAQFARLLDEVSERGLQASGRLAHLA
ncbi:MAG: glycosyltransferase family 4 protein [bacterium]|jgi:glycosyltransferase involved in cell wall biosynthesis|nr:glycosyltransferase family 4 protein [candidate division KSB1 bacterium]MDH7558786.1 glycosyltransferase family 4 protein [bacterium]